MRLAWMTVFLMVAALVAADGPRTFVIEGGTAIGEKPIKRTVRVEADSDGRVTKVSTTAGRALFTDFEVAYDGDQCRFAFDTKGGGGSVKIAVSASWNQTPDGAWQITLTQTNDVPASQVGKTTYPAAFYTRTRTVLLHESAGTYTWTDKVVSSTFGSDLVTSQYRCTPGKNVVREVKSADGQRNDHEVLDAKSSDSSPVTSGRMVYTRRAGKVHGQDYWAMEPQEWDGGASFEDGGAVDMSGDPLNAAAVTNVINYTLLSVPFGQDTWKYFGPTLFGIVVR